MKRIIAIKKAVAFLTVVIFGLMLAVPCAFAVDPDNTQYSTRVADVKDEANKLTDADIASIKMRLSELASAFDIDLVLVTVDTYSEQSVGYAAKNFYSASGYSEENGLMFFVSVDTREYWSYARGQARYTFDSAWADKAGDAVKGYLNNDDYAAAFNTYIDYVGDCLSAPDDKTYFFDNADLFSEAEKQQIQARIDEIHASYSIDVVMLTVNSFSAATVRDAAEEFYVDGGYSQASGIMFMLAMETRDYWTLTAGEARYIFDDSRISQIGDTIVGNLSAGNYAEAFLQYLDCVYDTISTVDYEKIPDDLDDYYQRYYPVETDGGMPILTFEIIVAVVGIVIGLIVVLVMKSKMNNVKGTNDADRYVVNNSFNLTQNTDMFLYSNVTKTPIPHDNDSSNGFSGGGGSSGGGGGGGFGGGGGKF